VTDEVEVWLDADFLERMRVGTLSHDRGTLRFAYDPVWLKNPQAFALDPDLSLGEGTYFPNAEAGNFRVFDDSAPDRWGQTLMKRREALAAKDEDRKPKRCGLRRRARARAVARPLWPAVILQL
jgi:serine/threonine-protein kinase HipA